MRVTRSGLIALLFFTFVNTAHSQSVAMSEAMLMIEGFSSVSSFEQAVPFEVDAMTGLGILDGEVTYETNRLNQTVRVHVDGDLTGFELNVEPLTSALSVLGMAVTGSAGSAAPLSFREPGNQPIVTGVTGAGATLPIRYTLKAVGPLENTVPHDLRVYFTID